MKINEDLQEGDPSLPLLPKKDTLTYLKIVELSQAKYNFQCVRQNKFTKETLIKMISFNKFRAADEVYLRFGVDQ